MTVKELFNHEYGRDYPKRIIVENPHGMEIIDDATEVVDWVEENGDKKIAKYHVYEDAVIITLGNIIKSQCVVVVTKDRNGKPHLNVCENMEVAKKVFGKCEKQLATFYKEEEGV